MTQLVPRNNSSTPALRDRVPRGGARVLSRIENQAMVRMATVRAEGIVQHEKVAELNSLTREAITGYTFLRKWADQLSGPDMLLADELRFFTDVARMGAGEIIADTIDTFCRESRGQR